MSEAVAFDPFANSSHYPESEIIDDSDNGSDDDDESYEEVTIGDDFHEEDNEDELEVEIPIYSDDDSDSSNGVGNEYTEEVFVDDSTFASLSYHDTIGSEVDSSRFSSASLRNSHHHVTNDSSRRQISANNDALIGSQRSIRSTNEKHQFNNGSSNRRQQQPSVNSNISQPSSSMPVSLYSGSYRSNSERSPARSHNISKSTHTSHQSAPFRKKSCGTSNNSQSSKTNSKGRSRLSVSSQQRNCNNTKLISSNGVNNGRCKSIAVLGTMSHVGKATIAAALCRILVNGGTKCAPFKAQNTSESTSPALLPELSRRDSFYAICADIGNSGSSVMSMAPAKDQGYGQIGTAQSLQAESCRIVPRVEMNPIFFKSSGQNKNNECLCSVIVMGKEIMRDTYANLSKRTSLLQNIVLESHHSLSQATCAEVIVIQGAGSCSELNLMDGDIVNLPLVRSLQCPWILVANDENGGVFAQVVGTKMCVSRQDWKLCMGIIVNKYKGEIKDSIPGLKMLEDMVGKPCYPIAFIDDWNVPKENKLGIENRLAWEKRGNNKSQMEKVATTVVVVVVVLCPHTTIANELYPLEKDPRFCLEWRRKRLPRTYPATTAIILPGSRLTLVDLKWLQDSGWADLIRKHAAAGGIVLGLCAGYQMLGWRVKCKTDTKQGIGLLPISSTVQPTECKFVDRMKGQLYPSGVRIEGFEINCGFCEVVLSEQNNVKDGKYPRISPLLAYEDGKPEGMQLGSVRGTCLHGILHSAKARVELLVPVDNRNTLYSPQESDIIIDPLDKFADHLQKSCGLDYERLRNMIFGTNTGEEEGGNGKDKEFKELNIEYA